MKKGKIILGILIVAWLCVIWGHSMQPAVVSEGESGKWLSVISRFIPVITNDDAGMYIVRKCAHFTEYAILGVLLALELAYFVKGWLRRFFEPLAFALSASFIDETIQLFVEGRSGQVSDMWIDTAGAALGIVITLAIIGNRRSKRGY
ncbi:MULTISPECIES: VanZ family protein [Pseudobutyrivibrio]|uniref:VanZ like family protein n=1 Tax=Pseudobutyrivibrio xylanivorans TaxID=185007 RepID=A0A1G5S1F4_PSEXY|nr:MULTISPECIES: VanZ family protein [Pseudobutyrivibrio]MDC7278727.1 VanZ family protein [Butyrivibrio fibrisolvens]SCZ79750.1 VanZ like family protein [Pseudobutyrivibrio xylanivorans]